MTVSPTASRRRQVLLNRRDDLRKHLAPSVHDVVVVGGDPGQPATSLRGAAVCSQLQQSFSATAAVRQLKGM